MRLTLTPLAAILISLPLVAFGGTPPAFSEVQSLWRAKYTALVGADGIKNDPEDIETGGNPLEIHLLNGEVAYLFPVLINSRGRNDWYHTVMARPAFKEIQEIVDPVRTDLAVHDLDGTGVSVVECAIFGSGGGTSGGVRAIVKFDGWKPIVLHQANFGDNGGLYGIRSPDYSSTSVTWKFTKLEGVPVLIERVEKKKGRKSGTPSMNAHTKRYAYVEGKFILYADYIRSKRKSATVDPVTQK